MTKSGTDDLSGPPLLEQLGALCSLLAHDLANQLCVISGSVSFAQLSQNDPVRLTAALETIAKASEVAGHAVSSFGEYRRTLPAAFPPSRAEAVVVALGEAARVSGWGFSGPTRVEECVLMPPAWAAFAARSIRTEIHSRPVDLEVTVHKGSDSSGMRGGTRSGARPGAAGRGGLSVRFAYDSEEAFSIKDIRSRYENLGLLAVFELNRSLGGRVDSRTVCKGTQEITLWLPFVDSGGGR